MDGSRFDDLVRRLGGGGSRRGVVRGLVAVATAGLAGLVGRREASGACVPYLRRCGSGQTCCNGAACSGGVCRCPTGTQVCNGDGGVHCVAPCPADQVQAAGCRCVCRNTGRPPVDGHCPKENVCPDQTALPCETVPPICSLFEIGAAEIPCYCVRDLEQQDVCVAPFTFVVDCDSNADCLFPSTSGNGQVQLSCIPLSPDCGATSVCAAPCDLLYQVSANGFSAEELGDLTWPPRLP